MNKMLKPRELKPEFEHLTDEEVEAQKIEVRERMHALDWELRSRKYNQELIRLEGVICWRCGRPVIEDSCCIGDAFGGEEHEGSPVYRF